MGKPKVKYVAKAISKVGWRIWNRRAKRWWGNYFSEYPQNVLDELNGLKRSTELTRLAKSSYTERNKPN